jgi:hypothetical protein
LIHLSKNSVSVVLVAAGLILLLLCLDTAWVIGEPLLTTRANDPWNMNNYFQVTVSQAYIYFAILPWVLSAALAAATMPAFFSTASVKKRMLLVIPAFASLFLGALGFNTFDWMLGCFYFPNNHPAPAHVDWMLFSFNMDVWNFYFFMFLVPLFVGGFLLGLVPIVLRYRFKGLK